jgi:hypothetical protein
VARQRPGLFLGGAVLTGFALGRFLKSSEPGDVPADTRRKGEAGVGAGRYPATGGAAASTSDESEEISPAYAGDAGGMARSSAPSYEQTPNAGRDQ